MIKLACALSFFVFWTPLSLAAPEAVSELAPLLAQSPAEEKEVLLKEFDTFFDPKRDYARFPGRVTDRDVTGNILKIHTENDNVKFYRAGDEVRFLVAGVEGQYCYGNVRSVEEEHFVVYVKDFHPCWETERYFRRGTLLKFYSPILAKRVKDAAVYRLVLIKRRMAFLRQLNEINNFIWTYDQQKVQVAAEFDKRILAIQEEKQKALDFLIVKKKDQVLLQKELIKRLDSLDENIDFYRVEQNELIKDRWASDHDLGLPVGRRPQEMKARAEIPEINGSLRD